jgi:hypothetical protein
VVSTGHERTMIEHARGVKGPEIRYLDQDQEMAMVPSRRCLPDP